MNSLFICGAEKYDTKPQCMCAYRRPTRCKRMLRIRWISIFNIGNMTFWEPTSRESLSKSVQVNNPTINKLLTGPRPESWGVALPCLENIHLGPKARILGRAPRPRSSSVGSIEVLSGLNSKKVFRVGPKRGHDREIPIFGQKGQSAHRGTQKRVRPPRRLRRINDPV